MKARAEYLWFPQINRRIQATARNCKACTKTGKNVKSLIPKNHLGIRPKPIEPNEELEIDFAGPLEDQKYMLLAVDRYSRYPLIKISNSNSTEVVIAFLEEYTAMFGIPRGIRSDQGYASTSKEYKNYCRNRNINTIFSPVGDHRGTRQVERLIKTVKERLGALKIE